MAELITTQEEKDAASYLDWDDASLGRFTKQMALKFAAACKSDPEGWRRVLSTAAAVHLACQAADANAARLTVDLDGVEYAEKKHGDWRVTVEKIGGNGQTLAATDTIARQLSREALCQILEFDPTESPAMEAAAVAEAAKLGIDPVSLLEAAENIAMAAAEYARRQGEEA